MKLSELIEKLMEGNPDSEVIIHQLHSFKRTNKVIDAEIKNPNSSAAPVILIIE